MQWVERFEACYRLWTPITALGAELDAAVKTYRDEPTDHLPWDPTSSEPYDPADQANGYARFGLYDHVQYLLELKRFQDSARWTVAAERRRGRARTRRRRLPRRLA